MRTALGRKFISFWYYGRVTLTPSPVRDLDHLPELRNYPAPLLRVASSSATVFLLLAQIDALDDLAILCLASYHNST